MFLYVSSRYLSRSQCSHTLPRSGACICQRRCSKRWDYEVSDAKSGSRDYSTLVVISCSPHAVNVIFIVLEFVGLLCVTM